MKRTVKFLVLTLMVAVSVSCSKSLEKRLIGKWTINEWIRGTTSAKDAGTMEFRENGTGSQVIVGIPGTAEFTWSADKDTIMFNKTKFIATTNEAKKQEWTTGSGTTLEVYKMTKLDQ